MLTTDDEELADNIRVLSLHGMSKPHGTVILQMAAGIMKLNRPAIR